MTSPIPGGVTERYRTDVPARRRRGRIMQRVFLISMVVALGALAALGYTVFKETFGLVAIEDTIEAGELSTRPLEEISRDELVAILQSHISPAVFRRLDGERPFPERSRRDVYDIVIDRVVEPEVVGSWPLNEALFQRSAIEADVARD